MRSFTISRLPTLHFGTGKISLLWELTLNYGKRVGFVSGANTMERSAVVKNLLRDADNYGIQIAFIKITDEPTPVVINEAVNQMRLFKPDVIVAIGGGSVLDGGKAISAMLCMDGDVRDYLEGVGVKKPSGKKIPFIAIPTTAGTGSEATKNAVISEVGEHGYKKSLRHDNFIPDIALIDPSLAIGCPGDVTARCAMDAFTQLLESYLSTNSNPVTDALAFQGLELVARSLVKVCRDGTDITARADMALAAYLSGITLANAGLGTVHGIAGPFGGFYAVPHGQICSALMEPVNRITVQRLRETDPGSLCLNKYVRAGKLFCPDVTSDDAAIDGLLNFIKGSAEELGLSTIAYPSVDVDKIVAASDNKTNPYVFKPEEMREAILQITA